MGYKYLAFMRVPNVHRPQWYIADMPIDSIEKWVVNTPDPFVLVGVSNEELQANVALLGNPNLRLKIDQLQAQYPDTTEEYEDEDGSTKSRTIWGYFSEFGRTDKTCIHTITMADLEVSNG